MLLGIPYAVFTGLASFVMSFLASRQKARQEAEDHKTKLMLQLMAAQNKNCNEYMKHQEALLKTDPTFAFTRRTLALLSLIHI